jgi:hypothetical protein
MDEPPLACTLYDEDGTLIARGLGVVSPAIPTRLRLTNLDAPGRLVPRYLTGHDHPVRVAIGDGPPQPARLRQIDFDPKLGRCCELELVPTARRSERPRALARP